jgi:PAS domain S-box-containing protein
VQLVVATALLISLVAMWFYRMNRSLRRALADGERELEQRRQAEIALTESENSFRTLYENIAGGIVIVDENYIIADVNERTCEITGYRKEELVGKLCDILCPKGASSKACPIWEKKQRGFHGMDTFIKCRDGSMNPILKDARRMTLQGKRMIFENFQDTFEQKQAESERSALEKQLYQAQKMEAVGQLAGGVAHDFNNLLQVIQGYGEMTLEALPVGSDAYSCQQEVMLASNRAAALVSQLLLFSRREALEMRPLDLDEVIANLMKMIRRVIGEHIVLEFVAGTKLGMVLADQGRIEQVLVNLCVNARDAMPTGGRLSLRTENLALDRDFCLAHSLETPGKYVCLQVADNGCGMSPEILSQIFDPFFTTKELGKGTGLGLATVFGIVRQHRGAVAVDSSEGVGTTFRVYLPQVAPPVEPVRKTVSTLELPRGSETIFLAEDDPDVRQISQNILERAGYRVLLARDGEEAIQKFETHAGEIDLAILDVRMPKEDGYTVYARIREIKPVVRVIFASGYAPGLLKGAAVPEAHGLPHISKPFKRAELLNKVREALEAETPALTGGSKAVQSR